MMAARALILLIYLFLSSLFMMVQLSSSFAQSVSHDPAVTRRPAAPVRRNPTRGKGLTASPLASSTLLASSTTTNPSIGDDDNDDNDGILKRQGSAMSVIKKCSNIVIVSALVDSAINFSTLRSQESFSAESVFSVESLLSLPFLLTFWKLAFAGGIRYASEKYRSTHKLFLSWESDRQAVVEILGTMAATWRLTSWVVLATAVVDTLAVFETQWFSLGLGVIIVAGAIGIRIASHAETKRYGAETTLDDNDDPEARLVCFRVARNMLFCVGAMTLRGVLLPMTALATPGTTWIQKGIALSGILSPFITAKLLWELRHAILQVLVEIRSSKAAGTKSRKSLVGKEQQQQEAGTYSSLFSAQSKFFSNVASTFKNEAIFKVAFALVAFIAGSRTSSGPEL